MDLNSILGITWFALCTHGFVHGFYAGTKLMRGSLRISAPQKNAFWFAYAFCGLIYLAGIVASISLFLSGSLWARWLIGFIAIAQLFFCIILFAGAILTNSRKKLELVYICISLAASLISLALLFSSGVRHFLNIKQ